MVHKFYELEHVLRRFEEFSDLIIYEFIHIKGEKDGNLLFYLVVVWETESLFEYISSRLVLENERDNHNLRDSGGMFQRDAPL